MLGRREHSEAELRGKLSRKFRGLSTEALTEITSSLKRDGYLSDLRFAENLVRSRVAKGYGPYHIRRELAAKGIGQPLIVRFLDEADFDWREVAIRLVERRHAGATSDRDAWMRAVRFLQRRGFSDELVLQAVGERP